MGRPINAASRGSSEMLLSFNPHPPERLDCNRMVLLYSHDRIEFQSSPNLSAGRSIISGNRSRAGRYMYWFQSSPSRDAGCGVISSALLGQVAGFNPQPNLSAGCSIG